MARTFGGAATDAITTTLTSHATQRSYAIWTYRTGSGGGGFGRIFDKRTSSGQVELLLFDPTDADRYAYNREFSGGSADWRVNAPSANAWHHVLVTYDSSSATNDPIIYIDGVSQSLTVDFNASGTANTTTDAFVIGNRTTGTARNWAGDLCEFAVWNRILTAPEAASIGTKKFSPLFYPKSLVLYVPLIRDVKDLKNNTALTVSGTIVSSHPRIIYPR